MLLLARAWPPTRALSLAAEQRGQLRGAHLRPPAGGLHPRQGVLPVRHRRCAGCAAGRRCAAAESSPSPGTAYLDFAAGIAVNCLGHSDKEWQAALAAQAAKLCHTSNLFLTEPGGKLAKTLVENSFADRVFFANSGTEANEAALKFARKFQVRGRRGGGAAAFAHASPPISSA